MAKRAKKCIPKGIYKDSDNYFTNAQGNRVLIKEVDNEVYYRNRSRPCDEDSGLGVFFENPNEYLGWKKFNDLGA